MTLRLSACLLIVSMIHAESLLAQPPEANYDEAKVPKYTLPDPLVTADGRTLLDFSSLSECSNLGHQHPRVVAAIREQAARLCFVTNAWGAEPRARLAQLLLEKSGYEGGRVFFTLGGADANEHAVKFARQASGKPRAANARDQSR